MTALTLPPDVPRDKASQTFLRHFDRCARSGYLYLVHKGEAPSPAMERGSCFHTVAERVTATCARSGEPTIPPELAKAILNEALTEHHVPFAEHDGLREMTWRWSKDVVFPPAEHILACETLFVLDLAGFQVRCKIDYAEAAEDGQTVIIRDYKTSRALPAYEEFARNIDGVWTAKAFQLVLYALVLAYGVPVRVRKCADCDGKGYVRFKPLPGGRNVEPCTACGGRPWTPEAPERDGTGVIETPEPFGVAQRAQRFDVSYVFPAVETKEGRCATRDTYLTRLELDEYRQSLTALLARVRSSMQSGEWPAQVSESACRECPAEVKCPIPREMRAAALADGQPVALPITSPEQAADVARWHYRVTEEASAVRDVLKAYVADTEAPLVFDGMVWRLKYQERRETDKKRLAELAQTGVPFDLDDAVKVSNSTPFERVPLEKHEAEAAA